MGKSWDVGANETIDSANVWIQREDPWQAGGGREKAGCLRGFRIIVIAKQTATARLLFSHHNVTMDTPAELVRSPEFWFDDGTVVLQVENTLYRVYRGLLASRSTVFRDTFSMPQPAEGREEIEGCPVVQLHDREKDFTRFLAALHHHGSQFVCSAK